MVCPQCRTPNPEGTSICVKCSTPIDLEDATLPIIDTSAGATVGMDSMATQGTSWSKATNFDPAAGSNPLQIGDLLASRYEILKLLGEGGMGSVYRARDVELDRMVALKVIRPELARNAQILQRFKQELILARQVTHRNIIRIFDLGHSEGRRFITMEYIEGEDLSTILAKRGKLPAPEAVAIIMQVARGLEAAHAEGVVHRDLKPQNIMVDPQGKVSVMDFGIARSVDGANMTRTGALMGTPTYMSPEQAQGQKVDARSDLYTLGIILYELLAGLPPFEADNPMATLVRRIQEKPKPPIEVAPEIPKQLNDIVLKMLGTQAGDRYQTAGEILQDLDAWEAARTGRTLAGTAAPPARTSGLPVKLLAAALIVMIGVVVWLFLHRGAGTGKPAAAVTSLSVLVADFHNGTGESVFDGTLEPAIGLAMEGASFISASNRNAARKAAQQLQPGGGALDERLALAVARQQGISVVISGDIEKKGSGYEIDLKALDPMKGQTIIEKSASAGSKQDVMAEATRLATPIRKKLGDKTPEAVQMQAAETYSTPSLEAAQSYAKGQDAQWAGKPEDAIKAYLRATELDSNMGRAYAGIAVNYRNMGNRAEAEKYFQLAISKLDRMSEREQLRTYGAYYLFRGNYDQASEKLAELTRKFPADDAGQANLVYSYFISRNISRAVDAEKEVVKRKPDDVLNGANLALYEMYAGQFDAAVQQAQEVLKRNASSQLALVAMALSQFAQGKPSDAAATYARLEATGTGGASVASIGMADIALYEGRNTAAIKILEKGIDADLANQNVSAAAVKLAALAAAQHNPATAERSLKTDKEAAFPSARVLLEAKQEGRALEVAKQIGQRPEPDPQAQAKLLEGEALLLKGKPQDAVRVFQEAQKLADSWIARFDLGRAYLAAQLYQEASDQFNTCIKRSGEATAVFLDDTPSYRYFPAVYYYLAQAQQALKIDAAKDSYRKFLAVKANADPNDSMVADARKRALELGVK
jgi:tetratricopeptide (TPR) repeat protein/predicted Ser/Thr protein kinase